MIADQSKLKVLLGKPELSWLTDRLRASLEAGRPLPETVTLQDPTDAQRRAADRLLGRSPTAGATLVVPVPSLRGILQHAGLCDSLEEAVAVVCGPVTNRKAQQIEADEAWAVLLQAARAVAAGRPPLQEWYEELRSTGLLRRLSKSDLGVATRLVEQVIRVLGQLPANGMPKAELAVRAAGGSHGLDDDQPLATLVLKAAACLSGISLADDAESRRAVWESAGIFCDELSAPVLVLNLAGDRHTLTGRALSLYTAAGEPCRLTISQLTRHAPQFADLHAGRRIFVCENPAVVTAAALRLGTRSAPLICVEGQPKTAARLLLDQLGQAGAKLLYHGDFDWGGIRIANIILAKHEATPWRMGASDYLAGVGQGPAVLGDPVDPSWDAALGQAIRRHGRALEEEAVLDHLLQDLRLTDQ